MATYEKVGDQYRTVIGHDAHTPIGQWMPVGFAPGPDDEVISPSTATAPEQTDASVPQSDQIDPSPVD